MGFPSPRCPSSVAERLRRMEAGIKERDFWNCRTGSEGGFAMRPRRTIVNSNEVGNSSVRQEGSLDESFEIRIAF